MHLIFEIAGGDFVNAGKSASEVKKLLKELGVPANLIKRVVVALYEAEVNTVAHAEEGKVEVWIDSTEVRMRIEDKGPGIEDIELAMKEGYSTASKEVREMGFGAGMGLPNIKRNTDQLTISSNVGKGTLLEIRNRLTE